MSVLLEFFRWHIVILFLTLYQLFGISIVCSYSVMVIQKKGAKLKSLHRYQQRFESNLVCSVRLPKLVKSFWRRSHPNGQFH